MAIKWGKKKQAPSKQSAELEHDEQMRVRQELGIQGLPEGQELMNTAIFSRVALDAALKDRALAQWASLRERARGVLTPRRITGTVPFDFFPRNR